MPRLRRETRKFKKRAIESLMLATELFNRPHDRGRIESVLIMLQHAFEMLLKGVIFQKRGRIHEKGEDISYTFDKCLSISLSDINIISGDDFRTLSILDCLRDCAMHNLLDVSENVLYLHTQAAFTIFDDILFKVFSEHLADYLPDRVLPISTNPPQDLQMFLDSEFNQIRSLLSPGKRRLADVRGRLRYHMIVESCVQGNARQPSDKELTKTIRAIQRGQNRNMLFPGVTTLRLDTEGHGLSFSVRFTRQEHAPPVRLVREHEAEAKEATLVREVNLLDRYSMGLRDLSHKLGITQPMAVAMVYHLHIKDDPDCFREFRIGRTSHNRYSPKALERLRQALQTVKLKKVWREYRHHIKSRKAKSEGI